MDIIVGLTMVVVITAGLTMVVIIAPTIAPITVDITSSVGTISGKQPTILC
jgi:hypothetical protein